jgi:Undecaprenyl-phosphate glucose phosphotransferase
MPGLIENEIGAARVWSGHRRGIPKKIDGSAGKPYPRAASDMCMQETLPTLLCVGDFMAILSAGFLAHALWKSAAIDVPAVSILTIAFGALAGVDCLRVYGAYSPKATRENRFQPLLQISRVVLGLATAICIILGLAFFLPAPRAFFSPWIVGWLSGSAMLLIAERMMLRYYLKRLQDEGRLAPTVAVVGSGDAVFSVIQRMKTLDGRHLHVVGAFSNEPCRERRAGTIDDLIRLARSTHLDEIRLVLPWRSTTSLIATVQKLSVLPVDITLDPWSSVRDLPSLVNSKAPTLPVAMVRRRPLSGWHSATKRAEDLVIAFLLLVFVAPVFGLVMLAIKLDDPGPIFFRQERYGFNNNRVMVLKFRTMHHDAHPDSTIPQATRNDPRVGRIGAFLRRTSLDELPQLINVLHGDMSIVGPRPHASIHNEKYGQLIDGYLARHRVNPGITGWAQVCGFRGETATLEQMRSRLRHDLYYIENWTLFFDLWIVLSTIPAIISGRNAY